MKYKSKLKKNNLNLFKSNNTNKRKSLIKKNVIPPSPSLLRSSKKKKQIFIDFGQKTFDQTECLDCKMIYTPGIKQEELNHKKYCKSIKNTLIKFNISKEGICIVNQINKDKCIVLCDENNQLKKINEIVFKALGSSMTEDYNTKKFLYLVEGKIVGYLSVELSIKESYPLLVKKNQFCYDKESKFECNIGINKIWVHEDFRRQKIASELLNCARLNSIYGYTIPKNKIAFSQPTPFGYKLALSFFENKQILIYN